MRFARRSRTGLYQPTEATIKEYVEVWDDFSNATGPKNGTLRWTGGDIAPNTIVVDPTNACNFLLPSAMFAANLNGNAAQWVTADPTAVTDTVFIGDQFARITLAGLTGSSFGLNPFFTIGLCVRCSGGNSITSEQGYYCFINATSSFWSLGVFAWNGTSVLQTPFNSGSTTVSIGDVFEMRATGTNPITITLLQNFSVLGSVTGVFSAGPVQHLFPTGAPGLYWGGGSAVGGGGCSSTYGGRVYGRNFLAGSLPIKNGAFQDMQGSGYWFPTATP